MRKRSYIEESCKIRFLRTYTGYWNRTGVKSLVNTHFIKKHINLQIKPITEGNRKCLHAFCGSVAKNLAILQNQWKTSQIGYLYATNMLIMIQKAIVIA
jgi:hypothetical protein